MLSSASQSSFLLSATDLAPAIVRQPLTINPTATVMDAIRLMTAAASCHLTNTIADTISPKPYQPLARAQSSCVLVLDPSQGDRLVGILTERDLVRLRAKGQTAIDRPITEVMITPVISLQERAFTDVFIALTTLQSHHIRHLPLVDESGCLVGLLTHDSLRQLLRPIDLLHLRTAEEVMTREVICVTAEQPIADVVELMTSSRISSIVIVEFDPPVDQLVDQSNPKKRPIGIITEQDIVQLLAVDLNFEQTAVARVMSQPVQTILPIVSLWSVRQLLEEQQINRLVVVDDEGYLIGIVTQTSLLNALSPIEIYQLAAVLDQKVERLEAEKVALLMTRNAELEQEVEIRTLQLQLQAKREKLVAAIADQIRSSLNINEVLSTAVNQIRDFLKCDRVFIYQFQLNWSGTIISESVRLGLKSAQVLGIHDEWLAQSLTQYFNPEATETQDAQDHEETHDQFYSLNPFKRLAIDNIHKANYSDCHLRLLEQYQVKSNLLIPIIVSGQLWGLIVSHHCRNYHPWQTEELDLLEQISVQLAIGLQQAMAYQQAQNEIIERQLAQAKQRESEEFLRSIYEGIEQAVLTIDVIDANDFRFVAFNPAAERLLGHLTEAMAGQSPLPEVKKHYNRCLQAGVAITYEECWFLNGKPTWWITTLNPIRNDAAQIHRIISTSFNIDDRKQSELALQVLIRALNSLNQGLEVKVAERTAALQAKEAYYRALMDGASDAIFLTDFKGSILEVNCKAEELLGYDRSQLTQMHLGQIYPAEDVDRIEVAFHDVLIGLKSQVSDVRIQSKAGQMIPVDITGSVVTIGKTKIIQGIFRDIRDRKQSEQENQRLKERLQFVLSANPAVIFTCEAGGDYGATFISDNIQTIMGYSPQEFLAKTSFWADHIHPDDQSRIFANLSLIFEKSHHVHEYRFQNKEGEYRWVRNELRLILDEDNQPMEIVGYFADITEQKKIELSLKERENFIQHIADSSPNILYLYDLQEQRNVYANREISVVLGYSPEEIQAMGSQFFGQIIHPDDLPIIHAQQNQLMVSNDGEIIETEYRMRHANGEWRWLVSRDSIFSRDASGQAQQSIGTAQDITDRKRVETKLLELSQRLEVALRSGSIGTWEWDFGNWLNWDQQMHEIYGFENLDHDVNYQDWLTVLHPDDVQTTVAAVNLAVELKTEFSQEFRIFRPDGELRYIKSASTIQYDDHGQAVAMIGVNYDITEQRRAQEAIANYTRDLEDLYNNAPCGYHSLDADGIIVKVNDTELSWFGYNRDEFLGHAMLEFIQEVDKASFCASYEKFKHTGVIKDIEYEIICKDGSTLPVLVSATAVWDAYGNYLYSRSTLFEIRDRKKYEQELQRTNAELTRATRLKDEFLASMSHELRTPLNAILGLSEGLQDEVFGVLNDRQKQSLSTIESSGRHLLELINDILDVSKIEAGQLKLDIKEISIVDLCQSSLNFVRHQALKKRIQLEVSLADNLYTMMGDERRLRQMLINLLNNAVKFTPANGRVVLEVHLESQEIDLAKRVSLVRPNKRRDIPLGNYDVCFSVSDTGIGIASEYLPKLFQPFMQIDSSLSRQYAGTGLGLTLVKQIAELHCGSITVHSELGKGSCFMVCLPRNSLLSQRVLPIAYPPSYSADLGLEAAAAAQQALSDLRPQAGPQVLANYLASARQQTGSTVPIARQRLILLAEDNLANISTLSSYLDAKGYQVVTACDGHEVLAAVHNQRPDLILMDIQMPGMDGLTAIRQLRQDPQLHDLLIVAVTALAMRGDREQCLQAGANAYMSKPVKLKELVSLIEKLLTVQDGEG